MYVWSVNRLYRPEMAILHTYIDEMRDYDLFCTRDWTIWRED
jgi:hypothetical protein